MHHLPLWFHHFSAAVAPFRVVNSYGLFAVMTKRRPEILFEGSRDGENYRSYRFKYKPGETHRRPVLSAGVLPPALSCQRYLQGKGTTHV